MNTIQVISLTLLSLLAASAQVIKPGRWLRPAVQQKFDAARVNECSFSLNLLLGFQLQDSVAPTITTFTLQYLGTWYEIQKLTHTFQKGECSTAMYSLMSPRVVGVLNREQL